MNLRRVLSLLALFCVAVAQEETEDDRIIRIKTELELIDWDLEDFCEDLAQARKNVLLHGAPYKTKINMEVRYGGYLKNQTLKLLQYSEDDVSAEFVRNYSVLTKPGDQLLTDEDWKMLVSFRNSNEELARSLRITLTDFGERNIGKHGYLNLLSTSRNSSTLKTAWSEWQRQVSRYAEQFPPVLRLVSKAVTLNERYDAKSYWETLTDYEDAYSAAQTMWEEVEPLYRQLHDFVLVRINRHYNENFTEIPVFLSGSNFGEDWSNIADIILPHPQIHHDVQTELQDKEARDLYKLAENTVEKIGFGQFGRQFWSQSVFNATNCSTELLSFCASRHAEIIACENADWSAYFTSHENALDIGLKSTDYTSLPRTELRYSILDDAVTGFASLFALHNLPSYGLLEEDAFTVGEDATTNQMSALLLLALRVLPKLPFYLAADLWRLEELDKASADININWWEIRKKYQGVEGLSNAEADYMGDPFVTSNKPYLSKFMGVFLQFQILSYHQISLFQENDNVAERLGQESDFNAMIHERPLKKPLDLLSYNYGFDAINTYPLLEFFRPLEEYFASAPFDQLPVIKRPKKPKRIDPPPPEFKETTTTSMPEATTTIAAPIQNDQELQSVGNIKTPPGDVKVAKNQVTSPKQKEVIPVKTAEGADDSPDAASTNQSDGLYIAITALACLLIVAVVFGYKKVQRMRRPRTNNRRFEA